MSVNTINLKPNAHDFESDMSANILINTICISINNCFLIDSARIMMTQSFPDRNNET